MILVLHNCRGYAFSITYKPVEPGYVVDCPAFPEVITSGQAIDGAIAHACETLDLHLEACKRYGLASHGQGIDWWLRVQGEGLKAWPSF